MAWESQKLNYENLTLWSNKEAQMFGASVLPPQAKRKALMSFGSYVYGVLKFEFMTLQGWLPVNEEEYLSVICTTKGAFTVKGLLQVIADIRFQT